MAHGQLRERELEQVMRDFFAAKIQRVAHSTIIETGIDIPTPTPSSSTAPINSDWLTCTSFAGASARSHHQPTPTCSHPNTSPKTKTPRRHRGGRRTGQVSPFAMQIWEPGAGEISAKAKRRNDTGRLYALHRNAQTAVRDFKRPPAHLDAPLASPPKSN